MLKSGDVIVVDNLISKKATVVNIYEVYEVKDSEVKGNVGQARYMVGENSQCEPKIINEDAIIGVPVSLETYEKWTKSRPEIEEAKLLREFIDTALAGRQISSVSRNILECYIEPFLKSKGVL